MRQPSVAVLLVLAACSPPVYVGSDVPPEPPKECDEVTAPLVDCPQQPWGARLTFASAGGLEQKLTGRWKFCGGERRYSGRGKLSGFAQGAGVELWSEGGQLRYAFLKSDLTRLESTASSGTVALTVENGRGQAVLSSGDGQQAVWQADFFDGQPVLQNAAFDVWNFVPAE